jgi:hypothetical protein
MHFKKKLGLGLTALTLAAAAHADVVFTEGFDNLATSGWITTNRSSTPALGWFQGTGSDVFAAQAGADTSYAEASWRSTLEGVGSIDNWLISPLITLNGSSTLTFYARGQAVSDFSFTDTFKVLFSAGSGTDTSTFTAVSGTITASTAGWTQYTFALPSAANGRIAFEYLVADANNANTLGIDSVQVATVSAVPEPATYGLMAMGLMGLAMLRRRSAS